jgi:hypothetical protein
VRAVVAPAFAQAEALEGAGGEAKSVRGVNVNDAARGVVAGRVVVAVFDEVNVVAEGTKARDLLQVMP